MDALLFLICLNCLIMLIWFNTNVIVIYVKYLPIKFKVIAYFNDEQKKMPHVKFPLFLACIHKNFFTKLLSCKFCLLFWLSVVSSLFSSLYYIPIIYCFTLLLYNMIMAYDSE